MAIDRVRKVWLVSPADRASRVPDQLARIALLHVGDPVPAEEVGGTALRRLTPDTRVIEGRVRTLADTLDVLRPYTETKTDLIANFIPTPIETTRAELREALDAIDIDQVSGTARDQAARRDDARAAAERADQRVAGLRAFCDLQVAVPAENALRWTSARLWTAPEKQARRVIDRQLGPEAATIEELTSAEGSVLVATVCLGEEAGHVTQRMRDLGFEGVAPPSETVALDRYVAAVEAERDARQRDAEEADAQLAALAEERCRQVELVLGHWEEELNTARAIGKMLATGRASVLRGYVRERELGRFEEAMAADLPEVAVVVEEPAPDDDVPVSLSGPAILRPAQFLVTMYGLPDYFEFDPSAFLFASFLIFFGMCLGDAVYGLLVIGMALWLMRRFRDYPGIRGLFELLLYGGAASFIVGVLTKAWASNLWAAEYLGEGNLLARLSGGLAIGDPLAKPMVVLGVALAMGVANQFWGIIVKMYSCWRKGDPWGALFDGGFWLLLLPGLLLLAAPAFVEGIPAGATTAGTWLAVAGAAGLVLTQGRGEKGIVAKAVVGVVSLYGIVGTYGCVSFISDILSYSRLLALGLTTTIVGLAVNIVAGMVKDAAGAAVLGGVLFALVAVPGHIFNVLISGLGAFIHSARLIFVEFFSRFYEPKAERFAPLGATYGRIRVMD